MVRFPAATRLRFLHHRLDDVQQPGGRLSQFTYGMTSPVILGRTRPVKVRVSRRVWRNPYPTRVWTYSRET